MFNNILVVCVGNICRSPMGDLLLKQALPDKTVHSAGVGALVDHEIDATAGELMREKGIDPSAHRARQLTEELAREADVILVMEKKHIAAVGNIAPAARGKTFLLGQWDGQCEIPDPYRMSREAFEHALKLIEQGCESWTKKL